MRLTGLYRRERTFQNMDCFAPGKLRLDKYTWQVVWLICKENLVKYSENYAYEARHGVEVLR